MDKLNANIWFSVPDRIMDIDNHAQKLVDKGERQLYSKPEPELRNLTFSRDGHERYVIFADRVGYGGMAEVYKGADLKLHRPVAVKILNQNLSENDVMQDAMELEAKAQARMAHPNIVNIHDIFISDIPLRNGHWRNSQTVMVMEWLDPQEFVTLNKLIKKGEGKDPKLLLRVARSLSNAVDFMASQDFFHRDLKPGNIFIGNSQIKIGDFGIASWVLNVEDEIIGSPAYMSPESVSGERVDLRSEIFTMGEILYEMVAGEPPFIEDKIEDTYKNILTKDYPPLIDKKALKSIDSNLLTALDSVLSVALQKSPSRRYATAGEFADALENALSSYISASWLAKYRLYYGV